jgi:hypothetical protein
MSRVVLAVAFGVCALGRVAAKTYVAIPDASWDDLVPYVRANIVPELQGDRFEVYVCPAHTLRFEPAPFDESLGDFTRVLVVQVLRHDRRFRDEIGRLADWGRERARCWTPDERARYRDLFWDELAHSPDVLPRIRHAFDAARKEARLRCWACEKDATYAPAARRIH